MRIAISAEIAARPAYQACEYKSGGEDRSSWTHRQRRGHRDGQGFNIRLHAQLLDGNIVLRTAKEKKQTPEGEDAN
jgi:hypothetical protein